MKKIIKNAVIKDTFLGLIQNSLTFYLILDLNGVGAGSISFGYSSAKLTRNAIDIILRKVGVEKWEDLKGSAVRVSLDEEGHIVSLGNFLKDTWMTLELESEIEDE